MKLKDQNDDQRLQLKQRILTDRMDAKDESPSYGELADADTLVTDEELEEADGGTEVVADDFS